MAPPRLRLTLWPQAVISGQGRTPTLSTYLSDAAKHPTKVLGAVENLRHVPTLAPLAEYARWCVVDAMDDGLGDEGKVLRKMARQRVLAHDPDAQRLIDDDRSTAAGLLKLLSAACARLKTFESLRANLPACLVRHLEGSRPQLRLRLPGL